VRAEFKKESGPRAPAAEAPDEAGDPAPAMQRPSAQEYWILKLIFLHEDLLEWASGTLDPQWIQHPVVRQIISKRLEAHRTNGWQSLGTFLNECESPEVRNLITEAVTEQRTIPDPSRQAVDVALRLRNQFIDRRLQALTQHASQPETDDATRIDLLRQQKEVRELKQRPIPAPS
jgi:hypothetical protein